jgi:hypothetical protein
LPPEGQCYQPSGTHREDVKGLETTQTNEELLCSLKATTEELVDRLSNYTYMAISDDCLDEGIALAGKAQRVLYDAFVKAGGAKATLERTSL